MNHNQAATVLGLGPLGRYYKVIHVFLSLVLGLKVFGRGYAANQDQLPDWGPFDGHLI